MSFFKIKDQTGDIYYVSKSEIVSVEVKDDGLVFSLTNGRVITHIHAPDMEEKTVLDMDDGEDTIHLTPTELLEKAFLSSKEFFNLT